MEPWTLEDGLKMIRGMQDEAKRFHYHIALGGSVLSTGRSKKDIDLYFLGMDSSAQRDTDGLLMWLKKMWGEPGKINETSTTPDSPTGAGLLAGNPYVLRGNPVVEYHQDRPDRPAMPAQAGRGLNDLERLQVPRRNPPPRDPGPPQPPRDPQAYQPRAVGIDELNAYLAAIPEDGAWRGAEATTDTIGTTYTYMSSSGSMYRHKLKFLRGGAGGDRIDCYIV